MAVSFTGSDPTYRPQLDGLRAVAVAAVAWSHWERGLQFGIPFGAGVHLFYVLSGFLITGILLRLRAAPNPARVLSAFYARRAQLPAPVAALEQVFQACVFAWPVARAAAGFRGWLGRVLESSPVTYLGRISYGVYLAHGFAGVIVAGVLATLGLRDVLLPEPLRFVALASVTIVTAALAWHFIEAPILAVKARVSYRTAPTPRPRSGGSEDPALPLGVSVEAGL